MSRSLGSFKQKPWQTLASVRLQEHSDIFAQFLGLYIWHPAHFWAVLKVYLNSFVRITPLEDGLFLSRFHLLA